MTMTHDFTEPPTLVFDESATIVIKHGKDYNGNPNISEWNAATIGWSLDNLEAKVDYLRADLRTERDRISEAADTVREFLKDGTIDYNTAQSILEDLDQKVGTKYEFEVTLKLTGNIYVEHGEDVDDLLETKLAININEDPNIIENFDWEWENSDYDEVS